MQHDFSQVEPRNFVSVPAGTYLCRVADVRQGRARDGSERWSMRLEVVGGDWSGKTAAWDSITWSERGIYRVKRVLECLGFDVSGRLSVEPDELVGRSANVQVEVEEWEDPVSGRRQVRTAVPFLGFGPADEASAPAGAPTGVAGPAVSNGRPPSGDEDYDPFAGD